MTIESPPRASVARFEQIEGLRAWLAWLVVGWHLIQFTDLRGTRLFAHTAGIAALAVEVFIIISGFVITHLLVTRDEAYLPYMARRAFRLYPLYLVAGAIGIVTTLLAAGALADLPWAASPSWDFRAIIVDTAASQRDHFGAHLLLHLGLLQGLVPDTVLPFSSTAMLGPAWSLSLEWQFYLVAPLVVGALAKRRTAPPMLVIMAVGLIASHLGLFGRYSLPSALPGAALLFLTGIASRLLLEPLRRAIRSPSVVAIGALALAAVVPALLSSFIWVAFFAFMVTADRRRTGPDRLAASTFGALFGSAGARWFGARSYAVYVIHWPILEALVFAARHHLPASRPEAALLLAAGTVPATLLAAELMHRCVEKPMIRRGAAVAAWIARRGMRAPAFAEPARTAAAA